MLVSLIITHLLVQAVEPAKNPSTLIRREEILVQVGPEIITTTDIEIMQETLRPLMRGAKPEEILAKAKEGLVDQKLKSIYLQQLGFSADAEVDRRMNALSANPDFLTMLQKRNMTIERFRTQLKLQIETAQFENAMRRNLLQTIEDKEIAAYFKNNPEQFKKNFEAELAECLIPYGDDLEATMKKATFFVNNPTKFGDCVKDLSQSPTALKGGKIGTFTWGVLPDEIEARIVHLRSGEVALNKKPEGIQLLKVLKIKDLGPVKFEQAQDRIRERLESEKLRHEYDRTMTELRSKTLIKIKS